MTKIIGIDLGTSNSAASVLEAGRPKMIPSSEGASLYGKAFPSIVAFTKKGEMLVGEPARRQAVSNPENTIEGAKRKIGSKHKYKINDKEYTPQQISAFILQKIKKDAEEYLGEKVEKAVITVPAYFDDNQRQATKDAGTIAGLEVIRIINEPTAAALAYGLDKKDQDQKILVFDLGGGTLDVTIMDFGDGVFEVKSTSGDTKLGGRDMDEIIVNYVVEEFKKKENIDLSNDPTAMQRINEASEKAKIELSTVINTEINLPFITSTDEGPKNLELKLTRAKLEELIIPIVERTKAPLEQALKDAKLKTVDKVILVGGPTRMPIVRTFLEKFTEKKAEGGVDPMECVAQGASIQAGVLSGDIKDVLLLDITPLSLGIETLGGVFTKQIERNTTIPTKKAKTFSTAADNQPAVTIRVFQGERAMAEDNKILGQFDLVGIPPAPRGIPQIEVTFDIDSNGIVHVSAKDKGTGKEQSIKITSSQKLKDEEIETMKKEAEKYAEEDKKRKENIELLNQAESLVYSTEQLYKDFEGKVDSKEIEGIKKEVDSLKKLLEPEEKDLEKIKKQVEKINELAQKASTEMYKKVAEAQASQAKSNESTNGASNGKKKKEKVVDAEVVDEKKK